MTTHIAIDLDGVLLDFSAGVCLAMRTEYGVSITPEDIDEWDLAPLLDPILGRSWWGWLQEHNWLWPNFPAVEGAIGAVDTLRRQGHYLEILTAKPEWAEYVVWKWLGKWRPAVHAVTIVGNKETKRHASSAEILIDDKLSNAIEWVEHDFGVVNQCRAAILFDQPYNRETSILSPSIFRGIDWRDVVSLIEELA